jgi:uncharacterized protein
VKLLLAEAGSDLMDRLWENADGFASCRLTYVESRAALARATRERRVDRAGAAASRRALEERWAQIGLVEFDEELATSAGSAAETFALRAGDALHLAAAVALADPTLVLATWDQRLRAAATAAGLAVV